MYRKVDNILVVEDDSCDAALLSSYIASQDLCDNVDTVSTVSEAKELRRDQDYDLYFIDVCLPDGSGIELAGELLSKNRKSPIIILSGSENMKHLFRSAFADVFAYVNKPITIATMLCAMEDVNNIKNSIAAVA